MRKKTIKLPLVDYILAREDEIRERVKEAKAESFSFYGKSLADSPGRSGKISDRTGNSVIRLTEEIRCVVLDDGEAIHNPEEWLKCIDAVRQEAKNFQDYTGICRCWYDRYKRGLTDYFGRPVGEIIDNEAVLAPENDSLSYLRWIRKSIIANAEEAGIWEAQPKEVLSLAEETEP